MDSNTSISTSSIVSGIQTPVKRRKCEEKDTKQAIINTMFDEVGHFGALVLRIFISDLEDELKPLPTQTVLQSSNDNVIKVWSQYFYKNLSPTKIKGVKTIPSPATERIGNLLHSIASFFGLTAEAVWYVDIFMDPGSVDSSGGIATSDLVICNVDRELQKEMHTS